MKKYLDFEVIKEDWGKLSLKDGSVLKIKSVLTSVSKEIKNDKPSFQSQFQTIQTVLPDKSTLGVADNSIHSQQELNQNIDKSDMSFTIISNPANKYVLDDNTKLNAFMNVIKIDRTTLKNRNGEPIYLVNTNVTINFDVNTPPQ